MRYAAVHVESLPIPTYLQTEKEAMPLFAEHRVHQRSTGRPYPNKADLEVRRDRREEVVYQTVHMENEYLDIWLLPQIGGRIFAAKDKTTGYDFFYRQHVIKPGLIGALGSWISGGVEFNWPYHHTPSGFMPFDFETEECADGSVICWMSEHDPVDRMKGMVGIVLRPGAAYLETRVQLCNRTPVPKSFLWWENAAVPVNEQYQIFFPKDVSYVNFHYLDSRVSYPVAGDTTFNGMDMRIPRDISWHKNTRDATSYFACASKYDFFGGYDHGKRCGVVHIADHHISPGKKMFTWAYNQLAKTWERTLTDTDGQYAELMAGSYTDNQPNFAWLEPYETKTFSQFWYPISQIGTPDYANLDCALSLGETALWIQSTRDLGTALVEVSAGGKTILSREVSLEAAKPVSLDWEKPAALVRVTITAEETTVASYQEEKPDHLKKPPVKDPMPLAAEMTSPEELYLAGVHVWQYRDPAVMPDAFWLEALKRDPRHSPSLLAMAQYCWQMARLEEAEAYASRALEVLTRFNAHTQSGDPYFLRGLIREALERGDAAYEDYRKAAWNGSTVAKAMARAGCIALSRREYRIALRHGQEALNRDRMHPLAPVILVLAHRAMGQEEQARAVIAQTMALDRFNLLIRFLGGVSRDTFFRELRSNPDQAVLDMVFDLVSMGQTALAASLLIGFGQYHSHTTMTLYTLAWLLDRQGEAVSACLTAGDNQPLGNTYPSRLEEISVLNFAGSRGAKKAPFLLGCLYYDKRQYETAAGLFQEAITREPDNYMAYRSLAVACYSHLGRGKEAPGLMEQAMKLKFTQQLLYERVILMDLQGADPREKIALLEPCAAGFTRDNLYVELAKAYNQNCQPQKARQLILSHAFIACEGGEHAIADQYMYSFFQEGMALLREGRYSLAYETFAQALTLPESLGSGIWNVCKYVPYRFQMARCLERMDRCSEAREIYRQILNIEVEFFSNMHLRELPVYQAYAAEALGMEQRAWNLMARCKREWNDQIGKKDNGFFATTPFFISFTPDPAAAREGCYSYLLGLVAQYEEKPEQAAALFARGYQLASDNLFCHYCRTYPEGLFGRLS